MKGYTSTEVAQFISGKLTTGGGTSTVRGGPKASIDTRAIQGGEIFFALAGEKTDGHNFIQEAFRAGASMAVVRRDRLSGLPESIPLERVIAVEDPLVALQRFAAIHRDMMHAQIIAVTGSNGKTTTRELIAAIFSAHSRTLSPEGNYNTVIGTALTLLRLEPDHEWAVLELGISAPGEMYTIARMVRPGTAVLTNVHAAHLEELGSVADVAREKCVLLSHMSGSKRVFINGDDPLLMKETRSGAGEPITFGIGHTCDVRPTLVDPWGAKGVSVTMEDGASFSAEIFGRHQVHNLLAAVAVARDAGLDDRTITRGLSDFFRPPEGRFHPSIEFGILLVDDTYNANAVSTAGAVEFLGRQSGGRFLLFGDMFELGESEEAEHREVGRAIADADLDGVYLVGERVRWTAEGAVSAGYPEERITHAAGAREALAEKIASRLGPGDCLVAKGSRAMRMEEILTMIREALQAAPAKGDS